MTHLTQDEYAVNLTSGEIERLKDYGIALTCLVSLQHEVIDIDDRPEWWTVEHDEAISTSLKIVSRETSIIIEKVAFQALDQQREADDERS